jgi:hypothetical protein
MVAERSTARGDGSEAGMGPGEFLKQSTNAKMNTIGMIEH